MAQLFTKSVWFRPIHPQLSVRVWKSKVPSRATFITYGRNAQPLREVMSSKLLSTKKIPQSAYMYCSSAPGDTMTDDAKKYNLIYRFPAIRHCKAISRLKLLQTGLTVLVLPPIYYYYLQEQVSQFAAVYCTGTALFAGAMLFSLSHYLRRIIGMIYVDDEHKTLKVSYLTFWGKRKNIFVPIEDVKKVSETGDRKQEIIYQFRRYSSPHVLYFTTRFGRILDREKFTLIFGELK